MQTVMRTSPSKVIPAVVSINLSSGFIVVMLLIFYVIAAVR
jgi:hypothetical protein